MSNSISLPNNPSQSGNQKNNETKLTLPSDLSQHMNAELPPELTRPSIFNDLESPESRTPVVHQAATTNDIDFILDIPVQLTVELGRTRMEIKNLLKLSQGAIIELNATVGQPMDVLANGCIVARGEVVMVGEQYGVRLTDVVTPAERIRRLNRA